MPNVDIVSLPLKGAQPSRLKARLTSVFCEKAGCGPGAVHIRFHPVEAQNYHIGNVDGAPDSKQAVFEINVAWYAGRSPEVQASVAEGLTEAVTSVLDVPAANVEVNFSELRPENHFEGGKRAPAP